MPSPLRIVLATLVTLVVIVVAIVPPILHFLTGPVAPAIGGFLAGRQFKLSDREAGIMGVLVALAAGLPLYFVLRDLVDSETFVIVAAIVASIWSGGLATVAAWFAGGEEETAGEPS